MDLKIPETLLHQMEYTKIERFHRINGRHIDIYTEGEYQIIDRNETVVIEDEIDSDLWYEVTFFDAAVFFTMYGMIPLEQDGLPCADFLGEISLDLLVDWDIMLLDTEAEIFITRNWDVYRIPFRYLLQSQSEDYLCHNLEFLGNYAPSVEDRIIGIVGIRGREYEIDRLCLR